MSQPLILVIETDYKKQSIAELLQPDFDICVATTGQEAIHAFQQNHHKIRLVIMELVLPDVSGMYVLRQFREISTLPEIIVCSGRKDIELAVGAMKEGAFDYIITPTTKKHINQILNNAIHSSDFVTRMQQFTHYSLFEYLDLDLKISIAEDIANEREIYEKTFTADDILNLFPGPESEEDEKNPDKFRKDLIYKIRVAIQDFEQATVLIVEDEDDYRSMIASFLSKKYRVITARDAQEALTICDSENAIDVIITDMVLPDMSGSELVPIMKKKHDTSEIIVLTAFERIDKAVQALRGGASDYLNKPVLKENLLTTVEKAFERRFKNNILPKVKQKMVELKLSDKSKYTLLNHLSSSREKQGKLMVMQDLYAFFPELRNTHIPEGLTLPLQIRTGLETFIKDLKEKLTTLNPVT